MAFVKNILRRGVAVFFLSIFLAGYVCHSSVEAAKRSGKLQGILTAKSSTWIEVKADGENFVRRYIPAWRGGLPREGGGLDGFVLNKIKEVRTGNRVELYWSYDEYFRAINLRILKPSRSHGTLRGVVVDKGDHWIDVMPPKESLERFVARWLGSRPEEGGGLDEEALAVIAKTEIGEAVLFDWIYDDRKRVVAFRNPNPASPEPSKESGQFPQNYPFLLPPQQGQPWFPRTGEVLLPVPSAISQPIPLPTSPPQAPPPAPSNPFEAAPAPVKPNPDDPFGVGPPVPAPPPASSDPFEAAPAPAVPNPDDPFGVGPPAPAPPPAPSDPFEAAPAVPNPDDPFGAGPPP